MGGADFGGGVWDLLAHGPRGRRQREAIADAIAPIWEANHVWLILVIVLLFTAWRKAFAAMMTALHIPLTAMLLGIVLRGTAFVFRKCDSKKDEVQRRWSRVFGISSAFTPFVQGLTLGALTTGSIRIENGEMYRGLTNWWAPLLLVWTTACAVTALMALWQRRFALARLAAIGQVTTILLGWCFAQYPHLVYPDLTIRNTAAPEVTLRLLAIALGLGAIVLLPSVYYLFRVFKGERVR